MFPKIDKRYAGIFILGFISILLGLSVIYGWYTNNQTLVQVLPTFAPMQYNTALGFLLSGLGVLFLLSHYKTVAFIFGGLVTLLGGLTLAQYIFHVDFGIDQLFIKSFIETKTSHLGRMAPNTALCFLLYGLALMLNKWHKQALVGMGGAVFILSLLALIGYFSGIETIYGWGALTRMAIHTAIGFVVLSVAIFLLGFKQLGDKNINFWKLSPLVLSLIVAVLTIFSWYVVKETAHIRNQEYFNKLVSDIEHVLKERYVLYEHSLLGGLGVFYASKSVEKHEWKSYVYTLNTQETLPGISGLGYIDYIEKKNLPSYLEAVRADGAPDFVNHPTTSYLDKFIIRFIEPEDMNKEAVGLDIGFETNRRIAAERARDEGLAILTKKIELVQDKAKKPGFLLLVPVYNINETPPTIAERRAHFLGWVYAPFIGERFLEGLADIAYNQIGFNVYDGIDVLPQSLIFSSHTEITEQEKMSTYNMQTTVEFGKRTWTIQWYATPDITIPSSNHVSSVILVLGLSLSFVLYVALLSLIKRKEFVERDVAKRTEQLRTAKKDLEKEVEKRTKEYKEQKIIAERAGKAKEDFLANMSHELRTPLNSIIGLTKILTDEGEFTTEQEETLDIIDKASNTLLKTVNDILDISKIESGKMNLENKSLNLSGVLHSLVDQFKPLASQKGLELKDNLSELKDIYVSADEHRISRIIMNLVGNAIKYTNEGYVKVEFEIEEQDEGIIDFIISVTDTGIGVPEDQQEGIFDKFTQADKSTERLYGGTGLGLSITKQLIELMAGTISLLSEVGKGSTFKVTLPLIKSKPEDIEKSDSVKVSKVERRQSPRVHISDAKILVAEDHEFNQVFIKKILKRLGNNNFKIVENGVDALAAIRREDYDMVLMDYHMPRMNGYDTAKNIRQYEREIEKPFNTPIIAMTADVMPGTEDRCLQVGMNDYVSKPIDEALLKDKIERWLRFSNDNSDGDGDGDDNALNSVEEEQGQEKSTYFDLTLLNEYTNEDPDSQKELIEIFYKKSLEDLMVLETNCVDGKNRSWVEAAHSLKGSSSYIGASTLKNLCSIAQSFENTSGEERLSVYKEIKIIHEKLCWGLQDLGLLDK